MSKALLKEKYQEILDITLQIQDIVHSDTLNDVDLLYTKRIKLIQQASKLKQENSYAVSETQDLNQIIDDVKNLDSKIIDKLEKLKSTVADELLKKNKEQNAVAGYKIPENSRPSTIVDTML